MKIQIVIPVYNEEKKLAPCLEKLTAFLSTQNHGEYGIVVADNGSVDKTRQVGLDWREKCPLVDVTHSPEKGRGRTLRRNWSQAGADILSYMDVDLSTGLEAFPRMIDALAQGDYDLATGSRLLAGANTTRCLKRECISRGYNLLLKAAFHSRFSDAQCGFKAITRRAAERLLPLIDDNHWFFDTELLVLAEKLGYRIYDTPVQWIENSDSRVKIFRTALEDIRGMLRLRRQMSEKMSRHSLSQTCTP
jgi:glycosyltransferase involved in cell wall biosynthesis